MRARALEADRHQTRHTDHRSKEPDQDESRTGAASVGAAHALAQEARVLLFHTEWRQWIHRPRHHMSTCVDRRKFTETLQRRLFLRLGGIFFTGCFAASSALSSSRARFFL